MIDRFRIQYDLDKFVSITGKQIGADIAYVDTLTDEKLAEGRVNLEFNEYVEIETPALDVINQASEVFTHGGSERATYRAERLLENIGDDLPSHVRFNAVENNITPKIESAFINEFEKEGFAIYELDIDVDGKQYQAVLNLAKDEDGEYIVSKDGDSYDIAGGFDGTNKEIKEAVENDIKALYGEKAYEEGYGLKATEAVLDILEKKIDTRLEHDQIPEEPKQKQKKSKGFGMSM
ncbi:hypothetical protein [Halomonas hibernica]|uniref:hypothetical protein n=1 Tax=Halomonas hibernica TaxID=2591147 RepID=UPI001556D659|nr:hypothetical protein [Halomonas hibernica]